MSVIAVGDIVMSNGKTWRQQNMEKVHNIPRGTLVEISYGEDSYAKNDPESKEGLRLFVCGHTRDCDGSPLYDLSHNRNATDEFQELRKKIEEKSWLETPDDPYAEGLIRWSYFRVGGQIISGMDESSLKIIRFP